MIENKKYNVINIDNYEYLNKNSSIKKFIMDINEKQDYENGKLILTLIKKSLNSPLYQTLICFENKLPIGIITITPDDGKNHIIEDDKPPFIWLAGFVIHRNKRHKGIGKILLSKAIEHIKKNNINKKNYIYLFTEKDKKRIPAIRLYKKKGFEIFKEDEYNYYFRKKIY